MHSLLSLARRFAVIRVPIVLSFICCCTLSLNAQSGGGVDSTGTGGRHSIQGRIYFPSGRRSDTQIKVRLENYGAGELSVLSDANGAFSFTGLTPGNYVVVVDGGEDYETVRESVFIDTEGSNTRTGLRAPVTPRVYTVQISLMPKQAPAIKAGVLDAELAQVPETPRTLYQKGLELDQAHQTSQAIENIKSAIALYPNFSLALNELGVLYLKTGQAHKALEPLRSAVKISPGAFDPEFHLGIAYLETQQFPNAELELRAALKISSRPTAHMYLGVVLAQLHHNEDAEQELKSAIALGGDQMGQAHKYLGGLYWRLGHYAAAADEL